MQHRETQRQHDPPPLANIATRPTTAIMAYLSCVAVFNGAEWRGDEGERRGVGSTIGDQGFFRLIKDGGCDWVVRIGTDICCVTCLRMQRQWVSILLVDSRSLELIMTSVI
jgi:hypothetical protein